MNDWKLTDEHSGKSRYFDSKSEAQEEKQDLESLVEGPLVIEKVSEGSESSQKPPQKTDGGTTTDVVEAPQGPTDAPEPIPERKPGLAEDPVDWMPSHFVDSIQGVPTVNRKGYCVIAEQYGVSVTAEPVTLASETDFEYAEFQAIAEKDGQEYSGFGSAHVDRMDGDDEFLLNELAETRAMKRAVAWATGMGITAIEEMKGEL